MKILILGGSGFFGKSFIDYYQREISRTLKDVKIILASRNINSVASIINKEYLNKKIFLETIDVKSCNKIPEADLVIHAANSTSEKDYRENPARERENIVIGAENIMKLMKQDSKIIYVSSGAIYGKQNSVNDNFKENDNYRPKNLEGTKLHYANAKIDAEKIVIKYSKSKSIKSAIARCYAFVGVHLPRDTHFFIGNMIGSILNNTEHHIKSKNKVFRSYMHADDLIRSLLFISEYANSYCEIFNIGSNEFIELHELAKIFSKKYKLKISGNKSAIESSETDIYIPNIDKLLSKGFKLNYNMIRSIENVIKELK